jgi:hypothetical protein
MSRYPLFDVSRLALSPLAEREHDAHVGSFLPLAVRDTPVAPELGMAAQALEEARRAGSARIFLCGAHVIRSGVQRYLFSLMEQGFISGIAVNGAAAIHDFEFAMIGATTESVARYIQDGRFGMWQETARLNDIIREAHDRRQGIGETLGREIAENDYPFKDISLFAKAWQLGIPLTVHVSIGQDFIHALPNMDGAATGAASYTDFLIFAKQLEALEGGCVCTFGSAVMAPEIFLKALSMARNVARQDGGSIARFFSLVCDLAELKPDVSREPLGDDPRYYFRPWKTLLTRTVTSGGSGHYVRGRHEQTIPALWKALTHDTT